MVCFNAGHFADRCIAVVDKYGDTIDASIRCDKCLNSGHRTHECVAKCDKTGRAIALTDQTRPSKMQYISKTPPPNELETKRHSSGARSRCGRDHDEEDCYASTDIDGRKLNPFQRPRKAAKKNLTTSSTVPASKNAFCRRCGRYGHWAQSCYARTHVNGTKLIVEPGTR